MRVAAFTRYAEKGASSRVRLYQFIPFLEKKGCSIKPFPLFDDCYLESLYHHKKRPLFMIFKSYLRRIFQLLRCWQYDVIWIEKELFPSLPFIFEWLLLLGKKSIVIDYDDAIFHRYKTHKIARLMRRADTVTCANQYLANYAQKQSAKKTEILHTSVLLKEYHPLKKPRKEAFTIGWIGTPITAPYLKLIEKELQYAEKELNAKFIFIGISHHGLNLKNTEVIPWDLKTISRDLYNCDVGIMPLPDAPFERGKSGYKLLQYFATNLPVLASAVGTNCEIVEYGRNGFLCETAQDWIKGFETLHKNPALRHAMGEEGRQKIKTFYHTKTIAQAFLKVLEKYKNPQ
ncbi:MAG: glycosyltransferase [Alphaproteobacteria bacterium]